MNWIKANKFLTGFFAVMLIGIGVLGYFLISASSDYDTADDNYHSKSDELERLRHLAPYPSTKNLKALEAQKTDAAGLVAKFQAQLATKEFPADDLTPQQFQDRLKEAVTEIVKKAQDGHMELPTQGKFYLGFDPYESRPPEPEAVGPLTRQLKTIIWVMEKLIDAKITKLTELTRFPLPEEKSLQSATGNRRQERPERGERGERGERQGRQGRRELVSKFPFDLKVLGPQGSIADVLDTIVAASAPQFIIPRVVRFKNQKTTGPERGAAGATVPLGYIVGEELLEANLRLEIVEFAPPEEGAAPTPKEAATPKPQASK